MENLVRYAVFLFNVMVVMGAPPPGETFKFTARDWAIPNAPMFKMLRVHINDYVVISCTTNDPQAQVQLQRKRTFGEPYEDAKISFKDQLTQSGSNFTLHVKTLNDGLYYQCLATDDKGKNEITLELGQLTINAAQRSIEPSIFPKGTNDIWESALGSVFNMSCEAEGAAGETASYLKWFKQDATGALKDISLYAPSVTVSREERITDRHIDVDKLKFKDFSKKDEGVYVCVRHVPGSKDDKKTQSKVEIKLLPSTPPKIKFKYGKYKQPLIGKYFKIGCEVSGTPKPLVSWQKNGLEIHTCSATAATETTCWYAIHPQATLADDGEYTCVATNLAGRDRESVNLVVQVAPFIQKPSNKHIAGLNEGTYKLYCTVAQGNPKPRHTWYTQPYRCASISGCTPDKREWKPVTAPQVPPRETPTMESYIEVNSTKIITNYYKCDVESSAGNDTYQLSLTWIKNAKPKFYIEPNQSVYTINAEEPLLLNCATDENVYKDSYWTKDGVRLMSNVNTTIQDVTQNMQYSVKKLSLSDAGVYRCFASYWRGGLTNNRSVRVVVKELVAPSISDFTSRSLMEGSVNTYTLFCDAAGNPSPQIMWEFNGAAVRSDDIYGAGACNKSKDGLYRVRGAQDQLIICSPSYLTNEGNYTCTAKNKVSQVSQTMKLTINAKPSILNWDELLQPGLSSDVQIECETRANPPANVTWYNGTKRLPAVKSTLPGKEGSYVLSLNELSKEDEGNYTCNATNKFGSIIRVVTLQVSGSEKIIRGKDKVPPGLIAGVIVGVLIILVLALLLMCWYKRRLKEKYALYLEPNPDFELDPDRTLFEQSSELPYDPDWEFPLEKITFLKTLGSGAFGQVWMAEAEGIMSLSARDKSDRATMRRKSMRKSYRYTSLTPRKAKKAEALNASLALEKTVVAVKKLKDDGAESEYKDLASELKILIHIGEHKNIVNLLGAVTKGSKLNVILEFCPHGSLLSFLRAKRDIFQPLWLKYETDMSTEFTYIDSTLTAHQVAKGMDFLQQKKCVHRDLAARNVLVGHDFVMKIADFGLARDIYKDEFYMKQTSGLLPVKWMAPESLFDKMYTPESDVWSYGILLWEIFTMGGSPYPGLPTEDLFQFLKDGKRMEQPDYCPDDIYQVMGDCWERTPFDRPFFSTIVDRLANILKANVPMNSDYLRSDVVDGAGEGYLAPSDNYLEPTPAGKQVDLESEYCPASLNGEARYMPEGHTYVPPPYSPGGNSNISSDALPPIPLTEFPTERDRLLSNGYKNSPVDQYMPMTPPPTDSEGFGTRFDDDGPMYENQDTIV